MRRVWLLFALGSFPFGAGAAEAPPIHSVTVYPDASAKVVRQGEVALPPGGEGALRLEGLPPNLESASLRVSAGEKVRVGAVETVRQAATEAHAERRRELEAELAELEDRKGGLDDAVAALKTRLDFVEGLAALPGSEGAAEAFTTGEAAASWSDWWQTLGEGARETRDRIRATQRKREKVGKEIKRVQKELERLGGKRDERLRLRVAVDGPEGGATDLRVAYRVRQARWHPEYEARLDTEGGRITLVRQAEVRQTTGEDWQGVRLSLATARPVRGPAPELSPWWVDFAPEAKGRQALGAAAPAMEKADRERTETAADTVHAEFSATYRVPGKISVPADNQAHRVAIGRRTLVADLQARVVPQKDQRAWLLAETQWDGEGALPTGPLRRYRDGAYVGDARLASWAPGEERSLAFGLDPRVEVAMERLEAKRGEEGLFQKQVTHSRRYRIRLANRHGRALPVTMLFRFPEPRDEAITVRPWEGGDAADRTDVDGRKGVRAWDWQAPAGGERVIETGYILAHPPDKRVPGFD